MERGGTQGVSDYSQLIRELGCVVELQRREYDLITSINIAGLL